MNEIEGYDCAMLHEWREKIGSVDWEPVWRYIKENVDASVPEVNWIQPGVSLPPPHPLPHRLNTITR